MLLNKDFCLNQKSEKQQLQRRNKKKNKKIKIKKNLKERLKWEGPGPPQ